MYNATGNKAAVLTVSTFSFLFHYSVKKFKKPEKLCSTFSIANNNTSLVFVIVRRKIFKRLKEGFIK